MSATSPELKQAVAWHQQGRIDEAEAVYLRILEKAPSQAHVRQLLGLIHYQRRNFAEAARLIEEAVRLAPNIAEYQNNLGEVYRGMNRLADAASCYGRALEMNPAYAHAHNNLGLVQGLLGKLEAARKSFRSAVDLMPGYAEAWINLSLLEQDDRNWPAAVAALERAVAAAPGSALAWETLGKTLFHLGRKTDAAAALRHAIQLKPDFADAHFNLGLVLLDSQEPEAAAEQFTKALELVPDAPEVHHQLGHCAKALGRFDEARRCFDRAMEKSPDFAEAYRSRGLLSQEQGDRAAALADLQQAIALNPNFGAALNSLGVLLLDIGQFGAARAAFERALTSEPESVGAQLNLASVLMFQGRAEEAMAIYERALGTAADTPALGDNLLYAMLYGSRYTADEIALCHRRWPERYAATLKPFTRGTRPSGRGRLRVGYVSPDFYDHAVARFLLPLLGGHDRERFEVFAYSDVVQADGITQALQDAVEHWRPVAGWSDQRLGEQIVADGIDILVDLSGHAGKNRLLVLARKPAPLQVTYLGYPNTTGLAAIDYRIVDGWSDPEGMTDPYYTEKLWRLPDTAWCYRPLADLPESEASPRLAAGKVAFGSFNNLAKMSAKCVELWAAVLRAVPHSTLALKTKGLADEAVCRGVVARFERLGVAGERLVFSPWTKTVREHMEYHREIDVALDTFPYHGTTTTCDALWMGVPVVTLAGDMHHSRVGVSLLTNAGLPDLIAQSPEEFVRIAVELAKNTQRLAEIRAGLRSQMMASPLRNEAKFAREFETALTAMRERQARTR